VRFFNLCVIKIPQGISFDQTDHILDTIIDTYFANRYVSKLVPITRPFPTESQFEGDLYDSPILTGSKLHAIEKIWRLPVSLERHFASRCHYHTSGFRLYNHAYIRISCCSNGGHIQVTRSYHAVSLFLSTYADLLSASPPEQEISCDVLEKSFCRILLPVIWHDPYQFR
jgi:hypothetical protein